MKNSPSHVLLTVFLFITAIFGAIALILKAVLGYAGFRAFGGSFSAIVLEPGCIDIYFLNKFGDGLVDRLKISYSSIIISVFLVVI